MSFAYYIVLDNEEPGFETFVNGKAVAHAADELDALCNKLGLPLLDSFMGQSPSELADMLSDQHDGDDEEFTGPEYSDATWFEPRDGLTLVDAIIAHLQNNPAAVASAADVVDDLHEYKSLLEQAHGIGAKWHLAIDF